MRQFRFRFLHLALLLISLLFYIKVRRVANIQAFLSEKSQSIDHQPPQLALNYGHQFKEAFSKIKNGPPAILLLNKFALNISLNFLCNLRKFPGAAERLVAVTFDAHSTNALRHSFPEIAVVHWPIPALEQRFSSGDGRYQLFQFFRAKLVCLLTEVVPSFWMVQADTIWREDLFQIIDMDRGEYASADMVFDSEGSEGLLRSMVAGGYFFVRSSNRTRRFFESVAQFLLDHFATDNNVMTRQCILGLFGNKCAQIPYSVIANWRKPTSSKGVEEEGGKRPPPSLFQFDGGDGAGDKFEKMRTQGHLFVDPETIGGGESNPVKCLTGKREEEEPRKQERAQMNEVMAFVQSIFELIHAKYPALKNFILVELFPYYAAYLFI